MNQTLIQKWDIVQQIPIRLSKIDSYDVREFYVNLVKDLKDKGYKKKSNSLLFFYLQVYSLDSNMDLTSSFVESIDIPSTPQSVATVSNIFGAFSASIEYTIVTA